MTDLLHSGDIVGGVAEADETGVAPAVPQDGNEREPEASDDTGTMACAAWLEIGSDVEIAKDMAAALRGVVWCEGEFWRYVGTHWEPIPRDEMRRRAQAYDGRRWGARGWRLRLGKGRIDSILHELGAILSEPDFFAGHRLGINCLSGFISFGTGEPVLVPHDREHRQRHVLQGRWEPGPSTALPEGSLLARLLGGCFLDDADAEEKVALLAEIAGAAALGHGTGHIAPKATILLGRTAENGKSQVLDLLRGLLPPSAVSSLPPSKFGDDRHLAKLVGKLLNTSDELGSAQAIASDGFKAIVTGEPVTARDVYRPAIGFRPQAQHVFACNQLPAFQGGMDRGVLRRLMPIPFNRTIPEAERIPNIGQRVAKEELDLLLAWAVEGASRLLRRRRFPELAISKAALTEWAQGADPVLGWLEDRVAVALAVVGEEPPRITSREAYADFKLWAGAEGYSEYRLPNVSTFVQRVTAAGAARGIAHKHSGGFRGFIGMRLKPCLGAPGARKADAAGAHPAT
jgi:putative DNA primase/helicase